jgi:hypothetical protein
MSRCQSRYLVLIAAWLCLLRALPAAAADNPQATTSPTSLALSASLDTYHAWDLDQPADNQRPGLFYNHSRHNEVTINLALIHLAWTHADARASIGLMAGTYAQDNYAHELPLLQHLYEASAGLRVAKDLWLDAGLFPSHIGFESAISLDNLTLSRSLSAENSPYYLAGARLTWAPSARWVVAAVVANGWQNMRETPDNRSKGGGTQVKYTPLDGLTLNWSTWVSDEQPRGGAALRVFNDVYASYSGDGWGLHAGVDVGTEPDPATDTLRTWWAVTAVGRARLAPWLWLGGRAERYSDPDGVILGDLGAVYTGGSLNLDLRPAPDLDAWLRVEGRALHVDRAERFKGGPDGERWNATIITSLALRFGTDLYAER